jgi:hypothetical protein
VLPASITSPSQEYHLKLRVGSGDPHDPGSTVKVEPSLASPEIVGSSKTIGNAEITPVEGDQTLYSPAGFVPVIFTTMNLPESEFAGS